ncbi:MAG: type VI secretion lipoprotein TssJ [Nocardioides sp.]
MFTLKVSTRSPSSAPAASRWSPRWSRSAAARSGRRTTPGDTCALPQNIQMVLRGGERLNPNDEGQALPVEVRVYQLKASAQDGGVGVRRHLAARTATRSAPTW